MSSRVASSFCVVVLLFVCLVSKGLGARAWAEKGGAPPPLHSLSLISLLSYLFLVHAHQEEQGGVPAVHDLVAPVLDEGALI
jgi:hypothetical protein